MMLSDREEEERNKGEQYFALIGEDGMMLFFKNIQIRDQRRKQVIILCIYITV